MKYNIIKQKLRLNKINFNLVKNVMFEKAPFFVLLVLLIYIYTFQKMGPGDDIWFQQVSKSYSLMDYLQMRYFGWTGRMSSEIVLYFIFKDDGFIWRVINPLVITLLTYSISRIAEGKQNDGKNCIINWYICISWLFISKSVIHEAALWMTGSIVYLWSMTAALFAIIPFRDALMKEYNIKINVLYLVCAIFASMGEEQVSLVLFTFMTIINIYVYIRHKIIYKYLIAENILVLAGTCILFFAPGNYVRNYEEIINCAPNYPNLSKIEIIFRGLQWLLNTLLNDSRVIFLLILIALSISLFTKSRELKHRLLTIIPILGCILIICAAIFSLDMKLPNQITREIEFSDTYHNLWNILNSVFFNFNLPTLFSLDIYTILKYILWPVIIVALPYFVWYLYDFNAKGIFTALIYIAGICSAMMMFISPTMYVSGFRTFFVLAIMFLITFIFILKKSNVLLKKRYVIILSVFAVLKYIFIFYYP